MQLLVPNIHGSESYWICKPASQQQLTLTSGTLFCTGKSPPPRAPRAPWPSDPWLGTGGPPMDPHGCFPLAHGGPPWTAVGWIRTQSKCLTIRRKKFERRRYVRQKTRSNAFIFYTSVSFMPQSVQTQGCVESPPCLRLSSWVAPPPPLFDPPHRSPPSPPPPIPCVYSPSSNPRSNHHGGTVQGAREAR